MKSIKDMAAKYHAEEAAKVAQKLTELGITIKAGDTIVCKGVGYPHMKDKRYTVTKYIKVINNILYVGVEDPKGIAFDLSDFNVIPLEA